jgi:diketogulonate reductase-like aldo/keto reductase
MLDAPTLLNKTPLPSLIYGTARRPNHSSPPSIPSAVLLGHRAFDLASSRRHHDEAADGAALLSAATASRLHRGAVFLQSKYAPPESHPADDEQSWPYAPTDDVRTQVFASVHRSAVNLGGLGVLDAYMLHTQLGSLEDMTEAWRALEELVGKGAIRYLGVCNVSAGRLRELWDLAKVKPTFVQGWFRPKTGYDNEVVRFCRQSGIVYQAFGVFDEFNGHLLESPPVKRRASAGAITGHQALLEMLFLAAKTLGLRLCILDGSRDIEHMKQNLAAVDVHTDVEAADESKDEEIDDTDDGVESFARLINWAV